MTSHPMNPQAEELRSLFRPPTPPLTEEVLSKEAADTVQTLADANAEDAQDPPDYAAIAQTQANESTMTNESHASQQTHSTTASRSSDPPHPKPLKKRFQNLVKDLYAACVPDHSVATNNPAGPLDTGTGVGQVVAEALNYWNRSRASGGVYLRSSTTTSSDPAVANVMIKITLTYDILEANAVDVLDDGRKTLYMPRAQLERVLGPIAAKAKHTEIGKGHVVLEDVLPTTFNAVSQWLNGKAILHTIPAGLRQYTLRELVHIYILAARLGHRSTVHDCVNNMPLTDTPFTFLKTCALIYERGCAGVAFRNFFRKGLPVLLERATFDHTDLVGEILQCSSELATDFAETMLGVAGQTRTSQEHMGQTSDEQAAEPFPSYFGGPQPNLPGPIEVCSCGLHDCTCSFVTASIVRPYDTHAIPRRSGYVETAPPSETEDEGWAGPGPWIRHDDSAGWDYAHRPVPSGSNIPGPALSLHDAEDQPNRPRNWSSAHIGHNREWDDATNESSVGNWGQETPRAANWAIDTNPWPSTSRQEHQTRGVPGALIPATASSQHATELEARLRKVEQQLERATLSKTAVDSSTAVVRKAAIASAPTGEHVLATSSIPPAPLLHPGVPPVGMPNYIPGYGYNRYVQIGNGVVHPTGPGPYGLAGRTMVATRNSDSSNSTLNFRAGDIIECVVPCEEGRSTTPHQPWNYGGQRMQGICRIQAGSFPAEYVRETHDVAPNHMAGQGMPPTAAPASSVPTNFGKPKVATVPGEASKYTTAANIDGDWLKSATPNTTRPPSTQPQEFSGTRQRRSPTVNTAIHLKHLPGCPSELAPWASCACLPE